MSHFNVSVIVWAKSQDSVHKLPFFGRERRAEADRTEVLLLTSLAPLPLGHTGSPGGKEREEIINVILMLLSCYLYFLVEHDRHIYGG